MKTHVIFVTASVFLAQGLTNSDTKNPFDLEDMECLIKSGINPQTVINNINDKLKVTEGVPSLNKFLECVGRRIGVTRQNGDLDFGFIRKELVAKLIPILRNDNVRNKDGLADDAIEKCMDVASQEVDERIIKFHNCVVDAITV
ncbi:hypothetical protein FQR65_LT04549 [Abscondita terminalis]|nr:hypothetical protein FQR65_LT04549 [Abscondita terminalis]